MALNWKTYAGLRPAGCLPCCSGTPAPPTTCPCALLLPFAFDGTTEYASLSDAQNVVLYNCYDCLSAGFVSGSGPGVSNPISIDVDITSTPGTTVWTLTSTATAGEFIIAYLEGYFVGPATLTFAFTNSSGIPVSQVELLDCSTRSVIDDDFSTSASGSLSVSVPSSGNYLIRSRSSDMTVSGNTAVYTMTSSAAYSLNPIVAYWDDSGTMRNLEACPMFYDPDGSGGTVYASLADAEYIRDFGTASCIAVGPTSDNPQRISFGASDLGTALLISAAMDNSLNPGAAPAWTASGGINLESGDTMSAAWAISTTGNTGSMQATVSLYRLNESFVYDLISTQNANPTGVLDSGTLTFPITITGNYRVIYTATGMIDSLGNASVTSTITYSSSGAFSVNPVEYLYGCSLDCPCALSCP